MDNSVTLKGSSELIVEFFEFSVNNILYQRGIYPPEFFHRAPKYGLSLYKVQDEAIAAYISNITKQLDGKYS